MRKAFIKLTTGSSLGKILGILREIITARLLGTGTTISAFKVSLTLLLVPAHLITGEIMVNGFLPYFSRKYNRDKKDGERFLKIIFWTIICICTLVQISFLVFGINLIQIIAPGFSKDVIMLCFKLLLFLLPSLGFYILGLLLSQVEMVKGNYHLIAIKPLIHSVGIILGVIFCFFLNNPVFLSIGFLIAYAVYFLLGLSKNLYLLKFTFKEFECFELKSFFVNIKYLFLIPLITQCNIILERIIATKINPAVVPAFDYAQLIYLTIFAFSVIPLSFIGLAEFGKYSDKKITKLIDEIIPVIIIFSGVISFFLYQFSYKTISIMFEHGNFDSTSTQLTASILKGFSFGIWAELSSYFLLKMMSLKFDNKILFSFYFVAFAARMLSNYFAHPYLNEFTLGFSSSIYGIFLFIMTFSYFKLFSKRNLLLMVNLLFCGLSPLLVLYLFPLNISNKLISFFIETSIFFILWAVFLYYLPIFKTHRHFVFDKLMKMKND